MSSEYAFQKRTARKTYWCFNDFAHARRINPGEEYYVFTDFPSSDVGWAATAGHPIQSKLCSECGRRAE